MFQGLLVKNSFASLIRFLRASLRTLVNYFSVIDPNNQINSMYPEDSWSGSNAFQIQAAGGGDLEGVRGVSRTTPFDSKFHFYGKFRINLRHFSLYFSSSSQFDYH